MCMKYAWVYCISTIDYVKHIAKEEFSWDGNKTPRARKFLSDLKDLLSEWDDIPIKKIEENLENLQRKGYLNNNHIVFIDCREPEEIKKLCELFNAKTILVKRDQENLELSNHADKNVLNYNYDIVIDNNGSLRELDKKAEEFCKKYA